MLFSFPPDTAALVLLGSYYVPYHPSPALYSDFHILGEDTWGEINSESSGKDSYSPRGCIRLLRTLKA